MVDDNRKRKSTGEDHGKNDDDEVVLRACQLEIAKGSDDDDGSGAVSLSSRSCQDIYRWEEMPALENYPGLKKIELYKQRYITTVHESLTNLTELECLALVRCSSLLSVPAQIGRLQKLVEVSRLMYIILF